MVFTTAVLTGLAPTRFIAVGTWELVGAIATGLALRNDLQRESAVVPAWRGTFAAAPIRKENNKE